jgi:hypothetical protein
MTLEAHAVAFVRDEDADYEALIMAEDESGAGARLEVQRALTVSEQDREAGLDTYALAVESGAVHYGGVQSWRGMDDAVAFELTDEAADALGLETDVEVRFADPEHHDVAVDALERLLGPAAA